LKALDALGERGSWELGGQSVRLTDLDKEVLPRRGRGRKVTRRDVVRYYANVAPVVLPYVRDRPLAPSGRRAKVPDWVTQARDDRGVLQVVADRPATLAWLAGHGVVELRASTATAEQPDRPSYAVVAVGPARGGTFDDVLVVARLLRSALDHLGVTGRPKVDGERGLEVWLPVEPRRSFADTRSRVEKICDAVTATVPEVAAKVRLDAGATSVLAPYSVRATAGAPVSVPLEWEDLDDPDLRPDRWTIRDVAARVAAGDPFRVLLTIRQHLPAL
jgi:bifunctional non-homologous end joining protein LigD